MHDAFAHVLNVVVLLGAGIVSGVFFAVAVSVIPMAFALPVDQYVEIHKLLGRNYDPVMPIIVISSFAADIALGVLAGTDWTRALFFCCALLLVGVSAVSHLCNVPINREVAKVEAGVIPADWHDPRPLWRDWHYLRTTLAILGLLGNAVAVSWMTY